MVHVDVKLVQTADLAVSIVQACAWVGVEVPETVPDRPSQKLRCPFGAVYHDDFGVEAAFRVYQHTNSAFCFAGCGTNGYFRPVSLCAMAWNLDLDSTAAELLRRVGHRLPGPEEQWRELEIRREQVDLRQLERAMKVYASRRLDNWPAIQYDDESGVSRFLSRCLGLLSYVETPRQAEQWRASVWAALDRFADRQRRGLIGGECVVVSKARGVEDPS